MAQERTAAPIGVVRFAGEGLPEGRCGRVGVAPIARAIVRLARARRRLSHLPTLRHVETMARLYGWDPCSYVLDPEQNYVPEPVRSRAEPDVGRHALCFLCEDPHGWVMELVTTRDGNVVLDLIGGGV
jgi:hypothetical protein